MILGGGLVIVDEKTCVEESFSGLVDQMVAGPGEEALVSFMGRTYSTEVIPPEYDSFLSIHLFSRIDSSLQRLRRMLLAAMLLLPGKAEGNPYKPIAPAGGGRD
jgi:hypothetical protein